MTKTNFTHFVKFNFRAHYFELKVLKFILNLNCEILASLRFEPSASIDQVRILPNTTFSPVFFYYQNRTGHLESAYFQPSSLFPPESYRGQESPFWSFLMIFGHFGHFWSIISFLDNNDKLIGFWIEMGEYELGLISQAVCGWVWGWFKILKSNILAVQIFQNHS